MGLAKGANGQADAEGVGLAFKLFQVALAGGFGAWVWGGFRGHSVAGELSRKSAVAQGVCKGRAEGLRERWSGGYFGGLMMPLIGLLDLGAESVLWVLLAPGVGMLIGRLKGRETAGFLWGFLGPLGWLVIACGPDLRRKCPACLGAVPEDAAACRNCGRDLPPKPEPQKRTRMVICPACDLEQPALDQQLETGLKCASCGVGFVPQRPAK